MPDEIELVETSDMPIDLNVETDDTSPNIEEINAGLAEKFGVSKEKEKAGMDWPLPVYPLTAMFDVQNVKLDDDQRAIVVAMYTGAGATFGLISRDNALALSSRLRKVANGNN
jgi:hypothetical protein